VEIHQTVPFIFPISHAKLFWSIQYLNSIFSPITTNPPRERGHHGRAACIWNQLTYISNNALSLTWFWQDNGKKLLDFLWWKQNKSRLEILARELIIIRILLLIPKTSSSRIFKWEIAVLYILPKQVIPSLRRYLGNTRNRFPRVENIVYLNVKLGKVYQTKEYGRLFLL
jgi:hypothetical protein